MQAWMAGETLIMLALMAQVIMGSAASLLNQNPGIKLNG
jgi:hypothetical protein